MLAEIQWFKHDTGTHTSLEQLQEVSLNFWALNRQSTLASVTPLRLPFSTCTADGFSEIQPGLKFSVIMSGISPYEYARWEGEGGVCYLAKVQVG